MVAQYGARLDGEDTVSPAPGVRFQVRSTASRCGFTGHRGEGEPSQLCARGVMLVFAEPRLWTFEALDDKVDLEDSVFLAGSSPAAPPRS